MAPDTPLSLVRAAVREMEGYVPGLQPREGQRLVKLNTNENPYTPSPKALAAIRKASDQSLRLYPDPEASPLRAQAASTYGLRTEQVVCGNGSDEILAILMRAFVDEGDAIAYFSPSYSLYPVLADVARARSLTVPLPRVSQRDEAAGIPVPGLQAKVFFLTTPNSPYGFAFPTEWIARLLATFPGIVVADEAYVDFAHESSLPLLSGNPRLIVVRSMSKEYALAGMRVGLAFSHETLARQMMKVKDSYNLGRLSQTAACAALADADYFAGIRERIIATRERFSRRLAGLGFTVLPSEANFLFAVPPAGASAKLLYEKLFSRGYLLRYFPSPALADGLRISIGLDEDMDGLARAIEEETGGGR